MIAAAVLLTACEARHHEVVEQACVDDGHAADYCRCMRKEMKRELGYQSFAVFSDLMALDAETRIEPDSILQIMDKHRLTPAKLAEIRESIAQAGPTAEKRCLR